MSKFELPSKDKAFPDNRAQSTQKEPKEAKPMSVSVFSTNTSFCPKPNFGPHFKLKKTQSILDGAKKVAKKVKDHKLGMQKLLDNYHKKSKIRLARLFNSCLLYTSPSPRDS